MNSCWTMSIQACILRKYFSVVKRITHITARADSGCVSMYERKVDVFEKKIAPCQTRLAEEDMQMFPNFDEYM